MTAMMASESEGHVLQVSFVLASQFLLKYLSLTAARWLHNSMLKQLLRSVTQSHDNVSLVNHVCALVVPHCATSFDSILLEVVLTLCLA